MRPPTRRCAACGLEFRGRFAVRNYRAHVARENRERRLERERADREFRERLRSQLEGAKVPSRPAEE